LKNITVPHDGTVGPRYATHCTLTSKHVKDILHVIWYGEVGFV